MWRRNDPEALEYACFVWFPENWESLDDLVDKDLEQILIIRDLFRSLSPQSKEIVRMLIYLDDLSAIATPKTKRITRNSFKEFLLNQGLKLPTIKRCFRELRRLVRDL